MDIYGQILDSETPKPVAISTPGKTDAYGEILDKEQEESDQRVNKTLDLVSKTNPDQSAQAADLSKSTGIPVDVVQRNLAEVQRRSNVEAMKHIANVSPILHRQLTDPAFARIAHDDMENLGKLEQGFRENKGPEDTYLNVGKDLFNIVKQTGPRFLAGSRLNFHDLMADDGSEAYQLRHNNMQPVLRDNGSMTDSNVAMQYKIRHDDLLRKSLQEQKLSESTTPYIKNDMARGLYSGVQSLAGQAPAIGASIATGGIAPVLGFIGAQQQQQAYAKYLDRGATEGYAAVGSSLEGGIEAGTEMMPMGYLVKTFGNIGAGKFLAGLIGRESMTEQIATHLEDAVDTAIANPEKTWGDYWKDRPDAALQTALATVSQSGIMAAASHGVQKLNEYQGKSNTAVEQHDFLARVSALAQASKVRTRDVDSFESFIAHASEDAPVSDVYIDAQNLFQSGIADQVIALSPSVADQFNQAIETGGEIKIPIAEYTARLSEFNQLLPHLKTEPNGWSQSDAEQHAANEGDRLQSDIEQLVTGRKANEKSHESMQSVKDSIKQQLAVASPFPEQVNDHYSTLAALRYSVMADETGQSAEQLYKDYPLFATNTVLDGQQYNQDIKTDTPVFKKWFSESKVVDSEGKPLVVYHGTATDFSEFKKEKAKDKEGRRMGIGWGKDKFYFAYTGGAASVAASGAEYFGKGKNQNVMPVYLRIVNPISSVDYHAQVSDEIGKGKNRDQAISAVDKRLKRNGIDGILDNDSGGIAVFNPNQIKSAISNNGNFDPNDPNILNQDDNQVNRGSYNPATHTITLTPNADLSTFLHELGHFFLEMQFDVASKLGNEESKILKDTDILLKWFGLQSINEWYNLDFEQKRSYHEKFAEAFEKYLFEGKAPSLELGRVFASVRQWMTKVYEHIKNFFKDIELTDEVRGVFDRMLATEEEIKQAELAHSMMPLFADIERSGMSVEQYAAYQAAAHEATNTAVEQLTLKDLATMQWLSNARNKTLKTLQKQHDELRREARSVVRMEVMAKPVYQAWQFLTGKLLDDGTTGRLELGSLREIGLPADIEQTLIKRKMTSKAGLNPDIVSEMFGFSSGDHIVRALAEAEPPKDLIERLTDYYMLQNHGELSTPEAINKEVDRAIHNDLRGRFIANEANALAKSIGGPRLLMTAAKTYAEDVISRLTFRKLSPDQYNRAEVRAGKASASAEKSGNIELAAHEKRNQALNFQLARAARSAKDEVKAGIARLKKMQKSTKKMRGEVTAQLNSVLGRFDLRTSTDDINKKPLADWIKEESERLYAVAPQLTDFIINEGFRKSYKDLTIDEFRQLMDGVKQIMQLAKRENSQYMAIRKQSFEEERGALLRVLETNYPEAFKDGKPIGIHPQFVPTLSKAMTDLGDKAVGELINAENIIDMLELGGFGPVFESLFSRLSHRSDWKSERMIGIYKLLQPLFKAYSLQQRIAFRYSGIFIPEIGTSITRENAVMVALLNGNKEGRDRLLNYGWDEDKVNAIVAKLNDKDINLIEGIWDLFDHNIWPELKALNERTRGKSPPKVEALPFFVNGNKLTGGYMRLKYDGDLDERAHKMDEGSAAAQMLGNGIGMSKKTNQGTSTQRVQGVKLRPRLTLDVFSETVRETIHDIALREAIADTMRILKDTDVMNAIKTTAGIPAYRALEIRVLEVAAPPRNPSGSIEKIISIARRNSVIAMLSGVKTALQNLTGYFPAMYTKVNAGLLAKEIFSFYSPAMVKRTKFVMNQSAYMRGLFEHFDRDLDASTKKLTVNGSIMPSTAVFLGLMGLVNLGVAVPIWRASFTEGMKKFGNDNAKATDYADHIVRQTQGSGRDVDLSKVMAGYGGWGELKKAFTMFYSYFNAILGLLVTVGAISRHEAKTNPALATAKFTAKFIFIIVIPNVLSELLMHGISDDDDPEKEKRRWANSFIHYGAALFPLGGALTSGIMSVYLPDNKFNSGFKLSPIEGAVETAIKMPGSVYDILTGEGTDSDAKTAIVGGSFMLGLPGKLISDTIRGTNAWLEGEAGPEAIVLGPPPK